MGRSVSDGPKTQWVAKGRIVPFLCLIIGFASAAPAHAENSKRSGTMVSDTNNFTQPQLLNADTDPTLRYPIGSLVGTLCASMAYGWLDISHAGMHFKVVQPLKRLDRDSTSAPGKSATSRFGSRASGSTAGQRNTRSSIPPKTAGKAFTTALRFGTLQAWGSGGRHRFMTPCQISTACWRK